MKRLTPETTVALLVLAGVLLLGIWFVRNTEWVDVWKRVPPRGEAARDALYAIKQVTKQLGATVHAPDNLEGLPPAGATLVLQSSQWDFVPGRSDALRRWVEVDGGHLVLPHFAWVGDDIAWVPVHESERAKRASEARRKQSQREAEEAAREAADRNPRPIEPPTLRGPRLEAKGGCPRLQERREGALTGRGFRLCGGEDDASLEPLPRAKAVWSIEGPNGAALLTVPQGKGRITVFDGWGLIGNRKLFHGDHAQAALTALDLRPGTELWFVVDERRDALALWLWHHAGPAIALALVLLALALWRGALGFGPLRPLPALGRRSMAEQIRGTAAFVWRDGGGALATAARRALDETARSRIAGYDRLPLGERAAALAKAGGMEASAITAALDTDLPPQRRTLAERLALLLTLRRRLRNESSRVSKGPAP